MSKLIVFVSLLNAVFAAKVSSGFAEVLTNDKTFDIQNILRRLENTENLVLQLHGRVEEQQGQIADLNLQLAAERRRTSSLEKTVELLLNETQEKEIAETDDNDVTSGIEPIDLRDLNKNVQRIRRADNQVTVAFFVTMINNVEHVGVDQIFVFDNVITNIGYSYSAHTGSFIAPVSGTYVFSVTIMAYYHVNAHIEFRKNEQFVSRLYVSGVEAGHETTSQTIILQLNIGDALNLHNVYADAAYTGEHYSSFAGFLLKQDGVVGK